MEIIPQFHMASTKWLKAPGGNPCRHTKNSSPSRESKQHRGALNYSPFHTASFDAGLFSSKQTPPTYIYCHILLKSPISPTEAQINTQSTNFHVLSA